MKKWIGLLLIGLASCGVLRKQQTAAEKPVWRIDGITQLVKLQPAQQTLYVGFDSLFYLDWLATAQAQIAVASTPKMLQSFIEQYEPGQFNNYSTVALRAGRPRSEAQRQLILIDRAELFLNADDYMSLLLYSWAKLEKGGSLVLIKPKASALPKDMAPPAEAGEGATAGQISLGRQSIDTTLSPYVNIQIIHK